MGHTRIEEKALRLLRTFERSGRIIGRVTIEGKKIELVFAEPDVPDDYERLDFNHDKT